MQSGRLYRTVVSYTLKIGIMLFFFIVLWTFYAFMFPQWHLLSSYWSVWFYVISVILAIGFTINGIVLRSFIIFKEKKVLSEINYRASDTKLLESIQARINISYLLADSIDREILLTIREVGGNLLNLEENLCKRGLVPEGSEYYRRIAKLVVLGLVIIVPESRQLYLTSVGVDATNTPGSLFVSKLPEAIWTCVFHAKTSLWQGKWGDVVIETSKALELSMRTIIKMITSENSEIWIQLRKVSNKPIERWTAGLLLGALRKLGYVRQNSFEDYLAGELVKLRNRVHGRDGKTFDSQDAERCDIYLNLLLRSWFGTR